MVGVRVGNAIQQMPLASATCAHLLPYAKLPNIVAVKFFALCSLPIDLFNVLLVKGSSQLQVQ
jgi:hypothetical protein